MPPQYSYLPPDPPVRLGCPMVAGGSYPAKAGVTVETTVEMESRAMIRSFMVIP